MPRYKKVNAFYAVCRAIVYKVLRPVIKPPNISVLSLFATYAVLSADCQQKQLLDRLLKHFTYALNKRVEVIKMIADRERIRA